MRWREYAVTAFDGRHPTVHQTYRLECSPPGGATSFAEWSVSQLTTRTELNLIITAAREAIAKIDAENAAEAARIEAEEMAAAEVEMQELPMVDNDPIPF